MELSSKLSESILVICNHCRRLSRQPSKFQEACSKASDFQVGKLERMKTLLVPEPPDPKSPGLPVKASKKAKKTPASPKCGSPTSVKTEDLLNMDIPATQSSLGGSLLDEAMGTEPIPVRKAVLREAASSKKAQRQYHLQKRRAKAIAPKSHRLQMMLALQTASSN